MVHTGPKLSLPQGDLDDAPAERRGVFASFGRVLEEDRDRDGGRLGGGETNEPTVRRAGRVLRRPGLSRNVDTGDFRREGERAGSAPGPSAQVINPDTAKAPPSMVVRAFAVSGLIA